MTLMKYGLNMLLWTTDVDESHDAWSTRRLTPDAFAARAKSMASMAFAMPPVTWPLASRRSILRLINETL